MAREHRLAGQQHDDLCACYWAAILMRAEGVDVDAGAVAIMAGTMLPDGGAQDSVPSGATPRTDDRIDLPRAPSPEVAGTSIEGLIEAVSASSHGRLTLVPLRAPWTAARVVRVLDICRDHPDWGATPLANLRTGRTWGSRLPLADAIEWLRGEAIDPPPPDWDVGHFVSLAGKWDGPRRSLVVVRDSYPAFGWDGHHLQPPDVLAAALERGDGREGGIALFARAVFRADIERVAKDDRFDVAAWDNGTPWHGEEGV